MADRPSFRWETCSWSSPESSSIGNPVGDQRSTCQRTLKASAGIGEFGCSGRPSIVTRMPGPQRYATAASVQRGGQAPSSGGTSSAFSAKRPRSAEVRAAGSTAIGCAWVFDGASARVEASSSAPAARATAPHGASPVNHTPARAAQRVDPSGSASRLRSGCAPSALRWGRIDCRLHRIGRGAQRLAPRIRYPCGPRPIAVRRSCRRRRPGARP